MKLQSSERRRGHTGLPGLVLGAGRSGGQHWAVGSRIDNKTMISCCNLKKKSRNNIF